MAIYTIELDGEILDIEGPDNASDADIEAFARQSKPQAPQTGLEKAVDVSNKVNDVVGTVFKPVGMALGAVKEGSDALADKLAESGHPILGLQAAGPSMLIEGVGKGMDLLDKAGEKTAEFGGRMGFPKTGAALGTAISMAPDIAGGVAGIAKRQMIGQSLKTAAKTAAKPITSPLKFARDVVTRPNAEEVRLAGKEAISEIRGQGAEKLKLARSTRQGAKEGLIEAEEKAGLHFESTPGFEAMLTDKKKMAGFSQKIGRLAKQSPEELAQSIPSEQLQLFRKLAQEGEKISGLSDIANSQLRHGKDIFTQALGLQEKGVGRALGRFRESEAVLKEIPSEIASKIEKSKLKTARDVVSARAFDKKRRVIKSLAKGAAAYLGLKSIFQ